MAYSGPIQDRLEIRELIEAYGDAVMRGDANDWAKVWAEDAYWALPEFPGHEEFIGREAIVAGWQWSMDNYGEVKEAGGRPVMIYVSTPGEIVVDGDRAVARAYTSEIYKFPGSDTYSRIRGRYDDELARIDGKWLFTKRIYHLLHKD
ncbi:MAG: nuclear transport factor 2 family protein [Sphingomonadaceae bacterium]